MIGRRVSRMDIAEPGGQQPVLGEREDQPRRRDHRAGEIAADGEHGRQRDRDRACGPGERAAHVDERGVRIGVFRDHGDEHQHDQEIQQSGADHGADERTRQYAARFGGFPGGYGHGLEADIGIDQQQGGSAQVLDDRRRRRNQCAGRHVLQAQQYQQYQRQYLQHREEAHGADAVFDAEDVGVCQAQRDDADDRRAADTLTEPWVQRPEVDRHDIGIRGERRHAAQEQYPSCAETGERAECVAGVEHGAARVPEVACELREGQNDGEKHDADGEKQPRAEQACVHCDLARQCENAGTDHRIQDEERGAEETDVPAQLRALVVSHPIPMMYLLCARPGALYAAMQRVTVLSEIDKDSTCRTFPITTRRPPRRVMTAM